MLNTLAIVKKMTAAGMPVQQAEAVAETLAETLEGELATKQDVALIQRDIADIKREIAAGNAALRREMQDGDGALKRDIKELESSLKRDIKEIDLKMEKLYADSQRQTLQVGIGMALLVITVLGFLFRFLAR